MQNNEKIHKIRHSLSHILAMAILRKFPDAQLAIGPVIDNGFYYDFLLPDSLSEADLPKVEKEMKKIISQKIKFEKSVISREEALKKYEEQNFKVELIDDLPKDEKISFYSSGDFTDLCAGPHVEFSTEINPKAFKLTSTAGAYWRGDENRQMLTRVYGVAFENKEELDEYLAVLEEAKKRDHRKLGKELDLFSFSDLVGSGLPLWSPKGTVIRNELQKALLEISTKYGVTPVTIPHIAKRKLYEISGHAEKFSNELIKVISHYGEFVMKPVNCPHHTQIYDSRPRSYRDLPIRYMESTMQYRDEKPGEISGLTRVRSITVDDGHTFCLPDQIKQEAKNLASIIKEFYGNLGLFGQHWVSLSVRDPEKPEAYIGDLKDWEKSEKMLAELSDELKLNAKRVEGEAAIYGPKLDYMFKDSLGREWQLATIQLDFAMPKRFELTYTDKDGKNKTPVMIHRAILGSYERFLAILIEHYAGAFPVWLAPVQIKIISVGEGHIEYCQKLATKFMAENIRVELDTSDETVGNKIRKSSQEKISYTLVIGDKEMDSKDLAVRVRGKKDLLNIDQEEFITKIKTNIKNRSLELL
ncbi:threonine--tRNA ligase [Candidatus Parcubacteria bacterium]|jgi:threonyl-tRNA synthetase|nr:threonine--tRNA ligase [Candidatus Parcubacteria bacterium]MBT7228881.1 threonine--tRNA ligase [Candidatus Parcubacteria bacterium]